MVGVSFDYFRVYFHKISTIHMQRLETPSLSDLAAVYFRSISIILISMRSPILLSGRLHGQTGGATYL